MPPAVTYRQAMRQAERKYLFELFAKNRGNVVHTARAAGVSRSTVQRLLKDHDITRAQLPNPKLRCLWWPTDETGAMVFSSRQT